MDRDVDQEEKNAQLLDKWRIENNDPTGFPTNEITIHFVGLDAFDDKSSGGGFTIGKTLILPNE